MIGTPDESLVVVGLETVRRFPLFTSVRTEGIHTGVRRTLRATTGGMMMPTLVIEGHQRDMSLNGAGMSLWSHTGVRHLTGMRRNLGKTLDTKGTTRIHTEVNLSLVRHREHSKFPHETHLYQQGILRCADRVDNAQEALPLTSSRIQKMNP